jgi:GcrA cell cycle regulator
MIETSAHNNQEPVWPDDRVNWLKELWNNASLTASQIARRIGVSRNAIIGKANRLGLKRKPPVAQPKIVSVRATPRYRPPPVPAIVEPVEIIRDAAFLNLTLDELKPGVCRYPHGDRAPFTFCGQPARDGSPYCALHCRMVLRRDPPTPPASRPWR